MGDEAGSDFLPVYAPMLDGREEDYVVDCVRTGWISSQGAYVRRFEEGFAAWCGARHGVAVVNCTAALHLALLALGIGPGDEVIIPDFTLIASANTTLLAGATPVAVDVEEDTWCLDPKKVAAAIGPRTRAIMAVHMYGHPADLRALRALCAEHDLRLIVDAAQAHGVEIDGERAGALGDVTCYSFYANKVLTTGEGGMVLTDDDALAERVRLLRNQAFREPRFFHTERGFNYRLTNLQAAVGVAQLERADAIVAAKRDLAARYLPRLARIEGLQLPVERPWAKSVYWMIGVVLGPEHPPRDEVRARLQARGIGTRAFFHPMSAQPALEGSLRVPAQAPVSTRIGARGLYLPSSPGLGEGEVERVVAALEEALR
ncbi:MAG: DegT/DnrJ/EryC1/StrS family aminotransferase [Planctomycetota bacterium]|nr:MAG: DegT/DnrJ/EryC1/StrS family aminotransferase [Planctomycetota bacterium]